MAERVSRERVQREKGYLYFLGKDGYLWRLPTRLNTSGRKSRVGTERMVREGGYLYFLDKEGYVARARMLDQGAGIPPGLFTRRNAAAASFKHSSPSGNRGTVIVHHTAPKVLRRCKYCNTAYDESLGKCPSCGAPF